MPPSDSFGPFVESLNYVPCDLFEQRMLAIMEAALEEINSTDTGWFIETSNLDSLRSCIYTFLRKVKDSGDLRFKDLMITKAPNGDGELWIIRKQLTNSGHGADLPVTKKYFEEKEKESNVE